jgi:coenzyme PQQ precursor peptide PqqA
MSHDHETRPDWQTPECEQISVSAEVTAYMGRTEWD